MSIEQNVAARKSAQEVGKFIEWESNEFADEGARRIYFEQLLHEVASRCPEVMPKTTAPGVVPTTDSEATEFVLRSMPFGIHVGKRVGDVPLAYLAWLADQPCDFEREVKRFIKNPMIQRQYEAEVACEF